MAVFRVEKNKNYTVMSNHHLRNKELSLKAKGLLSQMLSLPPEWDFTLSGLSFLNADGKDSIREGIKELELAGYVTRSRTRGKRGRYSSNEYVIREEPSPPSSEKPTMENPALEKPTLENPTQLNKEALNTDSLNTDKIKYPAHSSSDMERKEADRMREEREAYRSLIRENIEYDCLCADRKLDQDDLDEIVEIMLDAVCSRKHFLRVSGEDIPAEVVKSRLLHLDGGHIRFVLDCMKENTTKVRNIKQYLLTALYNAPVTISNYYGALVNHDLYGGGG